jgi:uncharacterized membrane protein HdeD (DUF308 family)
MESLKKIKWDALILAIVCAALGLILIIFPAAVNQMITYVLAASMFILAAFQFYNYFKQSAENTIHSNSLVFAVATLVLGIIVLAKSDLVISLIPVVLGIIIITSGVKKLQNAIDLLRLKMSGWLAVLIIAGVNIIFGIIMVAFAFETATVITILIGAGLMFSGLTDIFSIIWVSSMAKKNIKTAKKETEE